MSIRKMICRAVSIGVVFLATLALPPLRASAQCLDQWRPIFGVPPGPTGQVRSATVWDPDGPGPLSAQPVIGGNFGNIGGHFVGGILRFDGNMWLPFAIGLGSAVRAVTTWDPDGPGPEIAQLVAGGDFLGPGTLNHIARWDGTAWQPFAAGFSGNTSFGVYSLTTWDPDGSGPLTPRLVAGGNFSTTPGGTAVNRVAWWDGAAWQPLGTGFVNGNTFALTVYDPDGSGPLGPRLVAGGNWSTSGTTTVNRVAWWDGAAWQPFAAGFNDQVLGLTTWDPDGAGPQFEQVVATGGFLMSGTTAVQGIARWDGSAWQPLGSGVQGSCVSTWDPDADGPMPSELLAGGSFTFAGGPGINRVARWNGTTWQGFGTGIGTASVLALTNWDPDGAGPLISSPLAVGSFSSAGSHSVHNIARWQDNGQSSDWEPLGIGLSGNPPVLVGAMVNWDSDGSGPAPAQLVAGGLFTVGSGKIVNRVARWDGGEWQPLAGGVNGGVWGLTTWDPDGGGPLPDELVAVGDFTTAGGTMVNRVARWDGTQWQAFGTGVSGGSPSEVTTWDLDGPGGNPAKIVVGGSFNSAGGNPVNFVAMWDGSAWQPMGDGFIDHVFTLTAWSHTGDPADTMVYAGGPFGKGGAPPFNFIARWNGAAWEEVDGGAGSHVYAFTPWAPTGGGAEQLIVGGAFNQVITSAGAQTANRVAGFDGASWAAGFEPGLNGIVYALTTWDPDGVGPMLPRVVAGGSFTGRLNGGFPVLNGIAHWDSGGWQPFGVGMTFPSVSGLSTWDPDGTGPADPMLLAVGSFTQVGGMPGGYITALIAQGPIILSDPLSPAPVPAGSQVMLSVSATGGSPALSYRWHKNGVPLDDGPTGTGSSILGATLATLTLSNVSPADAGDYDCEVSNACSGVTSATATLSVAGGCAGDLNGDQQVDLLDFAEFQANFGTPSGASYADGDLDADGDVDLFDLELLLATLGNICP